MKLTLESICQGARRLVGIGPKMYKEPVIVKNEPIRVGDQILAVGDIVYMHPKEPQQNDLAALGRMREYRLFYKPVVQPDTSPSCLVLDRAAQFAFTNFGLGESMSWILWPCARTQIANRLYIPGNGSLDAKYKFYIGKEDIIKGMEENGNRNTDFVRGVLETFDFVQYSQELMVYDKYPPIAV